MTEPSKSEAELKDLTSFKEIREAKGISLEEIQKQTNFTQSKIAALDEMRFEDLGIKTFAVAYIQRYASVVGFDANPYLKIYKASIEARVEEESQSQETRVVKPAKPSFLSQLNFVHYVIIASVVWLLAMAFMPSDEEADIPEADSPQSSEVDSSESIIQNQNEEADTQREMAADTTAVLSEIESVPESPDTLTALETEGQEQIGTVQDNREMLAVDKDPTSTVESAVEVSESSLSVSAPQSNVSDESLDISVAPMETDVLVFSFTDECWVEVRDATEKVIFAELRQAGDNLQVLGQAPFEVMLGNARATSLVFNGEIFPVQPRANRRTLKFVVAQ